MNLKRITPKLGLVVALCLMATAGFAQNTKTVDAGLTSVTFSSAFNSLMQSLGIAGGTVAPTRNHQGTANFPITGGAIDLDTAQGNITLSGGMILEAAGTQLRVQSIILDTTTTTSGAPVLTALVIVNNALVGRLPLFAVTLPAGFSLPLKAEGGLVLNLKDVGLTLTPTAATGINSVFGLAPGTVPAGLSFGTANLVAFVN